MRKKEKMGAFAPWYDSDKLCLFNMAFMSVVNFFGWSGLVASFSRPEWSDYWHLPVFLVVSSGIVFLSTALRIFIRHFLKKTRDQESYL